MTDNLASYLITGAILAAIVILLIVFAINIGLEKLDRDLRAVTDECGCGCETRLVAGEDE